MDKKIELTEEEEMRVMNNALKGLIFLGVKEVSHDSLTEYANRIAGWMQGRCLSGFKI